MRIELRDSLEFLYPDSVVSEKPCRRLSVDVARGATASVHVLVNGAKKGSAIALALREKGKAARGSKWFRLVDVPVEKNTGCGGFTVGRGERNLNVTRLAPFRIYDAMEPVGVSVLASAKTQAFRLHVPIPADARPGKRSYVVAVRGGEGAAEMAFNVAVRKAVVPPAGRDSFPYTNWFSFTNMASKHGLKPWSEAHWQMIRRYAELMVRGRQNTFLVSLGDIFTARGDVPVLNRERLRRIVKVFTDAGMHFIEGGHVGGRTGGSWGATAFETSVVVKPATSVEGNAVLRQFGRQLVEEIDRNGWRDRWIQHAVDEPNAQTAVDYRILVGMVRKYFPGLTIMDATMDPSLAGSVNIWCPQAHEYQAHRDRFRAQQKQGDPVWFYTCCVPGGPYLNRVLDMELLRPALMGWAAAKFQLDGFLHWGLNQWKKKQDPFKKSVEVLGGSTFMPAGDQHVVYPGKGEPWSSLRFEAQREGFEDLELLRSLRARNAKKADAIIRIALRAFDDYTKDVKVFRKARKELLRMG